MKLRPSRWLFAMAAFALCGNAAFAQAVRRDLGNLSPNSQTLQSLQRALAAMRNLPANDPHSLAFQANIHGAPAGLNHPDFNQCQHANWWFLPWHRAYLYFFERIARRYSGDPTFALPYWNYADPRQRTLPAAYRDRASQLFDATRRAGVNDGSDALPEVIVVEGTRTALGITRFADFNPLAVTFGGPALRQPQHIGSTFGALENLPHNWVHGFVGGNMAAVDRAPRDPIFFSHHANVDRLWESWLQAGGGRANPSDPAWLDQTFVFYDENKRRVSITVRQCVTAAGLGYTYEGLTATNVAATQNTGETSLVSVSTVRLPEPRRIESSTSVTLAQTRPTLAGGNSKQFVADEPAASSRQLYLSVADVHFTPTPDSSLAVYLNMPANSTLTPADRHFAGYISFFGEGHHGTAHGLACTLDISAVAARLRQTGEWNVQQTVVTLQRVCPGGIASPVSSVLTFSEVSLLTNSNELP